MSDFNEDSDMVDKVLMVLMEQHELRCLIAVYRCRDGQGLAVAGFSNSVPWDDAAADVLGAAVKKAVEGCQAEVNVAVKAAMASVMANEARRN